MKKMNKTKLRRKEEKYRKILCTDTGMNPVPLSRFIMVCNAGLLSGYTEEKIVSIFAKYGRLETISMLPRKSYCFLEFKTGSDSKNVMGYVHGKVLSEINTTIYLLYVEKIPDLYNPFNDHVKPTGLYIYDDFITKEEENKLLQFANNSDEIIQSENMLKYRQVEHFGYKFCYDTSSVNKEIPLHKNLPKECDFIVTRLKMLDHDSIVGDWSPNQLTINHYESGQGIPPHIDSHDSFDDIILSLSLGSDVIMNFRHHDEKYHSILLRRRSLLVMSGESRLVWDHGIPARKCDVVPGSNGLTLQKRSKRISFTFRKVRDGPCNCSYVNCCDSSLKINGTLLDESSAMKLEQLHVHTVYEKIAEHFSETRQKPWPNIVSFINSLEQGSILMDIGCANGRFFGVNASIFQMGCDRSIGLCSICASKGHEVIICDCLQLPYRSNCVDACISIAVIHHLSTLERRKKAVQEVVRILKPGGRALIYVWAKEQQKNNTISSYLKQNAKNKIKLNRLNKAECAVHDNYERCVTLKPTEVKIESNTDEIQCHQLQTETSNNRLQTKTENIDYTIRDKFAFPIHENRTEFNYNDVLVEWKVKSNNKFQSCPQDTTYLRFYHVFSENELEDLCQSSVSNIKIIKNYYDEGNWCLILQKN